MDRSGQDNSDLLLVKDKRPIHFLMEDPFRMMKAL
jgi:hypothetical protein